MLIENLTEHELTARLRGDGIDLVTGAFTVRIRSRVAHIAREIAAMYGAYRVEEPTGIADLSIDLRSRLLRGPGLRPRIEASIDDERDLHGLPDVDSYAFFESALNWGIAQSEVAPLLLHAGVVERDGEALLLPAASGSGKSTLCAALSLDGWRLLSDEMAIVRADDFALLPNPRPVSLKNASIALIRRRSPDHVEATTRRTPKGDVSFMRVPRSAVERCDAAARASLIVSPMFREGAPVSVRPLRKREAFDLLVDNAANYASMLRLGFDALTTLVDRCSAYELVYSNLDEAAASVESLRRDHVGR